MHFFQDLKRSVNYLLDDDQWLKKTWPFFIICLIPLLGFFCIILLKGWRLEVIKSLKKDGSLPNFDFQLFIKQGCILWGCMLSYLFVPGMLCMLLGINGPFDMLGDIITILSGNIDEWLKTEPIEWLKTIMIYLFWSVLSYPVYQAGVIMYSVTGNWKSLINLPVNFWMVIRNPFHFISFYLSWAIISLIIIIIDMLLIFTGIGVLLLPAVTLFLYYSSTAYELSLLAKSIENNREEEFLPIQD